MGVPICPLCCIHTMPPAMQKERIESRSPSPHPMRRNGTALHAASVALDREYAGRGVRVVHVEIGPTAGTEFGDRSDPQHLPAARRAWTELGIPWAVNVSMPDAAAATLVAALADALAG